MTCTAAAPGAVQLVLGFRGNPSNRQEGRREHGKRDANLTTAWACIAQGNTRRRLLGLPTRRLSKQQWMTSLRSATSRSRLQAAAPHSATHWAASRSLSSSSLSTETCPRSTTSSSPGRPPFLCLKPSLVSSPFVYSSPTNQPPGACLSCRCCVARTRGSKQTAECSGNGICDYSTGRAARPKGNEALRNRESADASRDGRHPTGAEAAVCETIVATSPCRCEAAPLGKGETQQATK
eukprot:scaffold64_cov248-Pinguiococcus_pyrenoidosus.AAC.5